MSYCGCVGTLMTETGIVEIFGGVLKMLSNKNYPRNLRALRVLVEQLLRPLFWKHKLESMVDLHHDEMNI